MGFELRIPHSEKLWLNSNNFDLILVEFVARYFMKEDRKLTSSFMFVSRSGKAGGNMKDTAPSRMGVGFAELL